MKTMREAAAKGTAIDPVEKDLWPGLLNLGQLLLQEFIGQQGRGDLGPTQEYPGKTQQRLETPYEKRYVSVFGEIPIARTVYGTRESQKHEVAPLDARLNRPAGDFSFWLQDWSQAFCVQGSYPQSRETIARILEIGQSVRSLEHMNGAMAWEVEAVQRRKSPEKTDGVRGSGVYDYVVSPGRRIVPSRGTSRYGTN